MRTFLDRFILGFPVLFLKQYPYAWIAVVVFWQKAPSIAGLFLVVIAIGILSLRWQSSAWISQMRREHAPTGGTFHIDRPPVPLPRTLRNILFVLTGSALVAFLLKERIGLSFVQIFIMLTALYITYQDARVFGAAVTYIATSTGIAIRWVPSHLDFRLFLRFKEIRCIEQTRYQPESGWDVLARTKEAQDGLLVTPKDPNGFSKRIGKVFIVPQDTESFLAQLPQELILSKAG
ncbi:MAG: hypothetical protein QM730_01520 [Anaerolineales bacterium]